MSKMTRTTSSKSAKRRQDLRRNLPKQTFTPQKLLKSREFFNVSLVMTLLLAVLCVVVVWSRDQIRVRDGQIMSSTRIKRLDYTTKDEEATTQRRDEARSSSPRIYTYNESYLGELELAIKGLPRAVASATSLEEVSEDLQQKFGITEEGLRELGLAVDSEGQIRSTWIRLVDQLIRELREHPLIESGEFQLYTTNASAIILSDGIVKPLPGDRGIELKVENTEEPSPALRELLDSINFTRNIKPMVLACLTFNNKAIITFAPQLTSSHAAQMAAAIDEVLVQHNKGDVIYRRGDVLSASQYDDLVTETRRYNAEASSILKWQSRLGIVGIVALTVLFISVFIFLYHPRITKNLLRLLAIALTMGLMLILTVLVTIQAPKVIYFTALAPTLFVAIVILLAYDKRLAVIVCGMQSVLVVLALEQNVAWFLLLITACCTTIVQLREVRHRNSLLRAATVTAAVVGAGALALGLLELPLPISEMYKQVGLNAVYAITGCYFVGFVVLGILPGIERLFDITTGMTLAELRDPRQPLLRQLQQKAPGTYNHSLQVANIAEAGADAIGADSLLVYVGAMYHDIGKMSKPEYFIENQTGSYNKHEKLSPAMSLLVIIGHVKDGIELAREYNLPRPLLHFIEAHHGTTLVEYFYHAAKTQEQEGDRKDTVEEVEFRYPGPRPRTKEAAIMMLSDAVESATRAMAEPNPSRIESLVRDLSHKRLTDGQFDQCDLTFRELTLVEDAIISRVGAIHHSRISYPSSKSGKDEDASSTSRKTAAG